MFIRNGVILVLLALLSAGCAIDATVAVTVNSDGTGVIRVRATADSEAVSALEAGGQSLDAATRLSDLTGAGWTVGAWSKKPNGTASITITHDFDSVAEVGPLLKELNGDFGPVRKFEVTQNKSLVGTDYSLDAVLAAASTGIAADTQLAENLATLGIDQAIIDQQLLDQVNSSFTLAVIAKLPGGERTVVKARSEGKRTAVNISTQVIDFTRIAWYAAALILIVAALILMATSRRKRSRRSQVSQGRRSRSASSQTHLR